MDNLEVLLKIFLIVILAGLIGIDRELRHKPAGAKTHILVGLGSTIFTLVSLYMYVLYKGTSPVDPGRIAAQVVAGIGFLGAGTIIQSGGSVIGLTTAASLWSVAGIGLAVGCGMYYLAIVSTLIILFVFFVINKISDILENKIFEIEKKNKKIKK